MASQETRNSTSDEMLHVELEEVGARNWLAAMFSTLASPYGMANLRFVGVVDGKPRYKGATFPVPRTLGNVPPEEAWAPGMSDSLRELQQEIERDGWQSTGHGRLSWQTTYRRGRR